MKAQILRSLLALGLLASPGLAQAQTHYPPGVEGIKAASLPPPGLYFRDYNYIYFADKFKDGPPDFNLLAYVQAPRVIWISDFKVLGGYYGADVLVPFAYQNLEFTGFERDRFGLGDIFVEPITLSWHPKKFDVAVGYGFWAPSGDFDVTDPVSPGKGFWTQMFTAGATWYPDEKKSWSLSALNRYEINQENDDTGVTPGNYWTLEWGIAKNFCTKVDVGLVGYYQLQTTSASGPGGPSGKDHVLAIGPEINMFYPKLGLFASIRYLKEVATHDRPEGHTVNITFTKRF